MFEDTLRLQETLHHIYGHLTEKGVPITGQNIVHAMYDLYYADWLGGKTLLPRCPYEDSQANGL